MGEGGRERESERKRDHFYSASSLKSKLFEFLTVSWFLFHCRETKSSTKFIFCMEIY